MMKFGCCLPGGSFMPEGVAAVGLSVWERVSDGCRYMKEIGYDYAELTAGMVNGLTLAECRQAYEEGLDILAVNSILAMPLSGEKKASSEQLADYLGILCEKTAALGAKFLVFGSGNARRCPDGYAREDSTRDLEQFLRLAHEALGRTGLRMVIEPLNDRESNRINTLAEGARWARKMHSMGCTNIGLLADSFHLANEGRKLDENGHLVDPNEEGIGLFAENLDILWHCHVAEPFDRRYPFSGDGAYVTKVLQELERIGYTGGVTVECGFGDFTAESRAALAGMRQGFGR